MKKLLLIIMLLALLPNVIHAQDTWNENKKVQLIVGVNAMWEANFGYGRAGSADNTNFGTYGVSVETRFTRHSGLEVDLAIRADNCISIPVMYKFYSKIINFTAGISIDLPLYRNNTTIKAAFTPVVRIAKDIKLYKGLFIEPQIQINPLYAHSILFGVGLGVKYRF